MQPIAPALVAETIDIIGAGSFTDGQIEEKVLALAGDAMTARRLIDWIPEAFGVALARRLGKVTIAKTFSAKNAQGKWKSIPMTAEPVFVVALEAALKMYQEGPREKFINVARRSSIFNAINNALNAGASLDGAAMSGPALIGIPAEVYPAKEPFWKRIFR